MKRIWLAIALLFMIAAFSGCSATVSPSSGVTPQPTYSAAQTAIAAAATPSPTAQPATASPAAETDTPEPSPTPEDTMSEPTNITPNTNVYTSKGLGLTFTVPKSWVGKYRVEEGVGYLTVFFNLPGPIDSYEGDGELFTIMKDSCENFDSLDKEWEFRINGKNCGWGTTGNADGWADKPEYKTYLKVQDEIPTVFHSLRSLLGKAPDHVKTIWIQMIPTETEYITTMGLGIKFTLPKSWIGKCSIIEDKNTVSVYFRPRDYNPDKYGDGWLFIIARKSYADEYCILDGKREIKLNGAWYTCGGPTDVSYDGPEDNTFNAMDDNQSIFDTIRPVK